VTHSTIGDKEAGIYDVTGIPPVTEIVVVDADIVEYIVA
jgi:hypothetical protein